MHSFLIVSRNEKELGKETEKIAKKLKGKIREMPAGKIEDIRNLMNFTKLKLDSHTVFLLRDIDKSTPEASNALLKLIEEPQENAFFILSANSIYNVLPTISSRCQIIKVKTQQSGERKDFFSNKLLNTNFKKKVEVIENIKKKEDALSFIENIIIQFHNLMHDNKEYKNMADSLKKANLTRSNLLKNGNVNLHLSKFIIDLA